MLFNYKVIIYYPNNKNDKNLRDKMKFISMGTIAIQSNNVFLWETLKCFSSITFMGNAEMDECRSGWREMMEYENDQIKIYAFNFKWKAYFLYLWNYKSFQTSENSFNLILINDCFLEIQI